MSILQTNQVQDLNGADYIRGEITPVSPDGTTSTYTFDGIPSWANEIYVWFNYSDYGGSGNVYVSLRTAAGTHSTGYIAQSSAQNNSENDNTGGTDLQGFLLNGSSNPVNGHMHILKCTSTIYTAVHGLTAGNPRTGSASNSTVPGVVTGIEVLVANGSFWTDGQIGVIYKR